MSTWASFFAPQRPQGGEITEYVLNCKYKYDMYSHRLCITANRNLCSCNRINRREYFIYTDCEINGKKACCPCNFDSLGAEANSVNQSSHKHKALATIAEDAGLTAMRVFTLNSEARRRFWVNKRSVIVHETWIINCLSVRIFTF